MSIHAYFCFTTSHSTNADADQLPSNFTQYQLHVSDPQEPNPLYRDRCYFTVTRNGEKRAPIHDHENVDYNGYGIALRMPLPRQLPTFPLYKPPILGNLGSDSRTYAFNDSTPSVSPPSSETTFSNSRPTTASLSTRATTILGMGPYTKPPEGEVDVVITGEVSCFSPFLFLLLPSFSHFHSLHQPIIQH